MTTTSRWSPEPTWCQDCWRCCAALWTTPTTAPLTSTRSTTPRTWVTGPTRRPPDERPVRRRPARRAATRAAQRALARARHHCDRPPGRLRRPDGVRDVLDRAAVVRCAGLPVGVHDA